MYRYIFISVTCLVVSVYCVCPSGNVKESGVPGLKVLESVSRHNYWRGMIAQGRVPNQPKSSNMLRMKWDTTLASAAKDIANTCVFAHVKVTDNRWPAVGQNLFMSMSTVWTPGANWSQATDAWFNEVTDFTYPNVTATGKVTGHYTQVVWANSYAVGCGYTAWYDGSKWYTKLYVCNYGPAGNYVGQAPYNTGTGCEKLCTPPA